MKKLVWLLVPLFLPLALAGQDRVEKIEILAMTGSPARPSSTI